MRGPSQQEQLDQRLKACAASNHAGVSWHWADGRPRPTCGFCGGRLDHTQCARCQS